MGAGRDPDATQTAPLRRRTWPRRAVRKARESLESVLAITAAAAAVIALVIHVTQPAPPHDELLLLKEAAGLADQVPASLLRTTQGGTDSALEVLADLEQSHRFLVERMQSADPEAIARSEAALGRLRQAVLGDGTPGEGNDALTDVSTSLDAAHAYRAALEDVATRLEESAAASRTRARAGIILALGVVLAVAVTIAAGGGRSRVLRRIRGMARRRIGARVPPRDHLTGLPRRGELVERLDAELARLDGGCLAVLMFDLDLFGLVNRRYGRIGGDRVLQEAARRLRDATRSGDVVARVGGDQFAVLAPALRAPEDAEAVVRKLSSALCHSGSDRAPSDEATVDLEDERLHHVGPPLDLDISAAVGIAIAPSHGDTPEQLIDAATIALHAAKRKGAGSIEFFAPDLTANDGVTRGLATALDIALTAGDQLWLAYQPKVAIGDGTVVGVEALVRWSHPRLGALAPAEFIPTAEESDLILRLGDWVLDAACRQAARWSLAGGGMPVAVNVSPRQIRHGDLPERVAAALERHRLDPALLELEVTENLLLDDAEAAGATLTAVRDLGVRIAVDDFGTGYASLTYLKQFPIDVLKIDRSFVMGLEEDGEDAAITAAIVSLAHDLGLEVVAEGVETQAQLETLVRLGCDVVQGFLLAKPKSAGAISVHRMRLMAPSR